MVTLHSGSRYDKRIEPFLWLATTVIHSYTPDPYGGKPMRIVEVRNFNIMRRCRFAYGRTPNTGKYIWIE